LRLEISYDVADEETMDWRGYGDSVKIEARVFFVAVGV
jgi:hypothetical protein